MGVVFGTVNPVPPPSPSGKHMTEGKRCDLCGALDGVPPKVRCCDTELGAIKTILGILEEFSPIEKHRMFRYLEHRLDTN